MVLRTSSEKFTIESVEIRVIGEHVKFEADLANRPRESYKKLVMDFPLHSCSIEEMVRYLEKSLAENIDTNSPDARFLKNLKNQIEQFLEKVVKWSPTYVY